MNIDRILSPQRLKILLIGLPVALTTLYYAAFAADRFVSEAVVTVRQANQEASPLPGVALLLGGINPPSREDTLYVREYVHSLDMLKLLDERLQMREHFEQDSLDLFYRLPAHASQEWFLEYYRSRIEVEFDDVASLLTIRAQGFDPAFSRQLSQTILQESERFVNGFSQRIAREQMAFAEQELKRAADRLKGSKARLLAFQNKHKLLDPASQAQASGVLVAELQAQLSRQETELRTLRSFLNEDAYQVQALRNEVNALRKQLDVERTRSTTSANSDRLNELASEFRDLGLQARFDEDTYKLSLAAVENSRIDATRKIKSLVVIQNPALPESAEYPRRLYNLATLVVVCCLFYGLARLIVTTIRDHQD